MIHRLARPVRFLLTLAGVVWVVRGLLQVNRDTRELVRILEGIDPVTGARFGVRLTPLRDDELAAARAREAAIRRDPSHFATAG